jgi:hypothetical protein
MVRRRRRAARERIGKYQHHHGEAGRQRDAGYHDAPSAVQARSAVDTGLTLRLAHTDAARGDDCRLPLRHNY